MLQQQLPPGSPYEHVEVINGGAGFYTSMESLISLKTRLLPLDLDLVIDYDAANDGQIIMREGFRPDYSHARRSWTQAQRPLIDHVFGWSRLYGMFLDPVRRIGPRRLTDCLFVDGYVDLPKARLEDMGPGFETFYWTLREIVALARTHGVPVMLTTFAMPRTGRFAPDAFGQREGYAAVVQRLNMVARSVAVLEGAPLVDLERTGPSASSMFTDQIHPSAAGNEVIARRIAAGVAEQGYLARPPVRQALPPVLTAPPTRVPNR
jgi:lysophospholipase L1-like esterase